MNVLTSQGFSFLSYNMEIRKDVKNPRVSLRNPKEGMVCDSQLCAKGFSGHVQVHHIFLDFYYIPDNDDFFLFYLLLQCMCTHACVWVPAEGWGQRTILWCLLHPPLCRLGSPRCAPFTWSHLANPDAAQLSADSEGESALFSRALGEVSGMLHRVYICFVLFSEAGAKVSQAGLRLTV